MRSHLQAAGYLVGGVWRGLQEGPGTEGKKAEKGQQRKYQKPTLEDTKTCNLVNGTEW